jgi:pullulanase/glycogen debranching enzyme
MLPRPESADDGDVLGARGRAQDHVMVAQDPVVSRAKLVAEPWDVGQMDS